MLFPMQVCALASTTGTYVVDMHALLDIGMPALLEQDRKGAKRSKKRGHDMHGFCVVWTTRS